MGRIRTGAVKRAAETLLRLNKGLFTVKFEDNKKYVQEKSDVSTKRLRNQIAGYITKRVKTQD